MRLLSILAMSAACLFAAPPKVEKPFLSGGRVILHLEAGGYTLEASPDNSIRVICEGPEADRVRVEVDTHGREAEVEVRKTPRNHFHARIQVPARTDLKVKLSAGELDISGIEGHKDLYLRAGELRVAVPDPNAYRTVQASVLAGEIDARAWDRNKGGLFRSLELEGSGKYDLKAKVLAGEIGLRR